MKNANIVTDKRSCIIWLKTWIGKKKKLLENQIDIFTEFNFYGMDSIDSVELSGDLEQVLSVKVEPTILFNYPNIEKLAIYIEELILNPKVFEEVIELDAQDNINDDIAIIGMGCRFPGANNTQEFWNLLFNSHDAIITPPKNHSHFGGRFKGGFLKNIDLFANEFFNISPREAKCIDPQQRLLLEVSYEAIEDAGIRVEDLVGSDSGVFIGIASKEYDQMQTTNNDMYAATGGALSIAANRLSYFYDLKGPSIAIDTACSSSLMAIHLACQSLKNKETSLAIAGGANLLLSLENTEKFAAMGFLSPDYRCSAFDASANGYVRSEGVGIVILKPVKAALANGDQVYAVIKASATNQDGHTNGITAPNQGSQESLLRRVYSKAGILPSVVNYVECHGTGTSLGDPIEMGALNKIIGKGRGADNICKIGSVKTNIGHLETAAGVASLIKVALMIYNKTLLPSIHFKNPNPNIDFTTIPFAVQQAVEPITSDNHIFGINSFGFGGSNVHAVLSGINQVVNHDSKVDEINKYALLPISAKSIPELELQCLEWQKYLQHNPNLIEIGSNLALNRTHYAYRFGLVAKDNEDALIQLSKSLSFVEKSKKQLKIGFVFTGQGSQWAGMAQQLLTHTTFRKWLIICDSVIAEFADFSILEVLLAKDNQTLLSQSNIIQPTLVAYQIALAEYLRYLGIKPNLVLGHSLGEIAASYLAGGLTLEDAMLLAFNRGLIMNRVTGHGSMLSINLSEEKIKNLLKELNLDVDIAVLNSPSSTVVSGDSDAIEKLANSLIDIEYVKLPVNYAFHSKQIDPLMIELKEKLLDLQPSNGNIPMVSTVTGTLINTATLNAEYWAEQMRKPVLFLAAIQEALTQDIDVLIEIGASAALANYITEIVEKDHNSVKVMSVIKKKNDESLSLSKALANAYQFGCDINWNKLYTKSTIHKLPHYVWQRKSYWAEEKQNFESQETNKMPSNDKTNILDKLMSIISELIEISINDIDIHKPFIELGADSIIIVNAIKKIQTEFGVKIEIRRLFEDLQTISTLADFLVEYTPVESSPPIAIPAPSSDMPHPVTQRIIVEPQPVQLPQVKLNNLTSSTIVESSGIESIFSQQLQVMNHQLQLLSGMKIAENLSIDEPSVLPAVTVATSSDTNVCKTSIAAKPSVAASTSTNSWQHKKVDTTPMQQKFNANQQECMKDLIDKYTKKTAMSKSLVGKYRSVLADSKASVGFRLSIKEMLYPIVGEKTYGSKLVDVDGNEYIDITMGFGVHLCGYNPSFLSTALSVEVDSGIQLGPRSKIVGEVAQLVAEITGLERVAFSNTGTESVITAIRIARAATGKNKIVLFKGAYHGHSDYSLVESYIEGDDGDDVPLTPGIPKNVLNNTIVLEYGDMAELDKIRRYHNDIAAVLVEPVQSKRPDFQPVEFVRELRNVTSQLDIALIFDEMVTGFRSHIGGAQAIFGVKADMATYGKIIGGGLPIGIIAGSKKYMDHIDGGMWNYGDNSYPESERTFFGGTFCQHPTSLATALAILKHLKQEGNKLQEQLNLKTANLTRQLNQFFESENVPIEVVCFSSLFRFKFQGNFDLLFYYLIIHGVYVWEWRNCFLSTAHTDADIEKIIAAVKQSVYDMKQGGFI